MDAMKLCTKCGVTKPLFDFYANKKAPDGCNYKCKTCDKAYQAERYLRNPEAIKQNAKRWADKNQERKRLIGAQWRADNRDVRTQKMRQWYADNADTQRAKQAEWRAKNKEFIAKRNAEWRRNNPGKDAALSKKKKADRLKRTPLWADFDAIERVYQEAAEFRALGIDCHVDHEIPLQGRLVSGLHVHTNLRIITAQENLRKSNRFVVE